MTKHPSPCPTHHPLITSASKTQEFLGFLDELKCIQQTDDVDMVSPFPPRRRQRIEFFVAGAKPGEFRKVALAIRTTGGDCRNVVEKSLVTLFAECGMCKVILSFVFAECGTCARLYCHVFS